MRIELENPNDRLDMCGSGWQALFISTDTDIVFYS